MSGPLTHRTCLQQAISAEVNLNLKQVMVPLFFSFRVRVFAAHPSDHHDSFDLARARL
jgi:hypothetical protein